MRTNENISTCLYKDIVMVQSCTLMIFHMSKYLLDSTARDFPCKLFHTTGNCVNGEECMFSHEALTEDTQELLDKVTFTDILNSDVVLLLFLCT